MGFKKGAASFGQRISPEGVNQATTPPRGRAVKTVGALGGFEAHVNDCSRELPASDEGPVEPCKGVAV